MAEENAEPPSAQEISAQLERILDSKLFRDSPTHSKMLAYIVRNAERGKEITEEHIRQDVFPGHSPDSTVVRTQANYLRKRLAEYYAEGATNDPILIRLPPGKHYTPVAQRIEDFASTDIQLFALLHDCEWPGGYHDTMGWFDSLISVAPSYARLRVMKATVLIWYALLNVRTETGRPHKALLEDALAYAESAIRLKKQSYTYTIIGAAQTFMCHWDLAETAFDSALNISAAETERQPWYAIFLLARGRVDEAMQIVDHVVKESPDDGWARTIQGLFLYVTRQFALARAVLHEAVRIDENFLAALTLSLVHLAEGDAQKAMEWLDNSENDLDGWSLFPGVRALCFAQSGNESEAKELAAGLGGLQGIFARLALRETEKAAEDWHKMAYYKDPVVVWSHLWPFLDPLRDDDYFRRMCKRIQMASSSRPYGSIWPKE